MPSQLMTVHTLASARVRAGLTQRAVASHLGVHYQTLGRWEEDPTQVPTTSVLSLCDLYALPLSALWLGTAAELRARLAVRQLETPGEET